MPAVYPQEFVSSFNFVRRSEDNKCAKRKSCAQLIMDLPLEPRSEKDISIGDYQKWNTMSGNHLFNVNIDEFLSRRALPNRYRVGTFLSIFLQLPEWYLLHKGPLAVCIGLRCLWS